MKIFATMKETVVLRKYGGKDWRWTWRGEDGLLATNLKSGKQVMIERVIYTGEATDG